MSHSRLRCTTCKQYINTHDKTATCTLCMTQIHKGCLPLFGEEQFLLITNPENKWTCCACNIAIFPFTNIEDNDELALTLMQTDQINQREFPNESLFKPMELLDSNIDNYLMDCDPDENFYNETLGNLLHQSNYETIDSFNDMLETESALKNGVSCMCLNIRSAPKNLGNMEHYLHLLNLNFKIIGLTETWFTVNNVDAYNLDGYNHTHVT